jgi:hypothetical protein
MNTAFILQSSTSIRTVGNRKDINLVEFVNLGTHLGISRKKKLREAPSINSVNIRREVGKERYRR